jgi:hypothetical protein
MTVLKVIDTLAPELSQKVKTGTPPTPDERVRFWTRKAGIWLWSCHGWHWRTVEATLNVSSETTALPGDFREFNERELVDTTRVSFLNIVGSQQEFRRQQCKFTDGQTGYPEVGVVFITSPSTSGEGKSLRVIPVPTSTLTYEYTYIADDPWTKASTPLLDDGSPLWPDTMDEGWILLTRYRLMKLFNVGSIESQREAWIDFSGWLKAEKLQNDKNIASGADVLPDDYGDFRGTSSQGTIAGA